MEHNVLHCLKLVGIYFNQFCVFTMQTLRTIFLSRYFHIICYFGSDGDEQTSAVCTNANKLEMKIGYANKMLKQQHHYR